MIGRGDDLLVTTGQLDSSPLGVRIMGDNCGIVTACPCKLTTVSSLLLEIADDSSLRHVADRHHIANGDVGFLATVHELSGVHTFGGHEQLLLCLVPVWVTLAPSMLQSPQQPVIPSSQ